MGRLLFVFLSLFLIAAPVPAYAQLGLLIPKEKTAIKEGFAFPKDGAVRVLVFRPDVHVGEQTTGGLNQPNADWTNEARLELTKALAKMQADRSNEMKMMPELTGDDNALMSDYRSLFKAVADAVISHKLFPGNRLPTKKERFDWTLGSEARKLGDIGGGDYGLFLYTYDSYGSTGRKVAQVLGMLAGFGGSSGVHLGYAGLVDLKTGDLIWINADIEMGGDVRTPEGATKRIKQLLEEFPGREGAVVKAKAK
jgi:hypothetical protein